MKTFILLSLFCILLLSNSDCKKKDTSYYKGRLEIKALCMNYTISILEGKIDTSLTVANWTDETTHKQYQNVFKLGSPCSFPGYLKERDEFYFEIDSTTIQNCAICLAYYPTPSKSLGIKVIKR